MVVTTVIHTETRGFGDTQNLTPAVQQAVRQVGLREGTVTLFVPGSTGALTTIEYEPGVIEDLQEALEKIAPIDGTYRHHLRWGDDNGYAHVRAAILGPSLSIPVLDGKLLTGTWQQIVLIDFDTRPRSRRIIVQCIGDFAEHAAS